MVTVRVSTPSRICLFGEHQDYLGLEVIAAAINLHFRANAVLRDDNRVVIRIRDSSISELGQQNPEGLYEETVIDLDRPIVYETKRDYFRSVINQLRRSGYPVRGADVRLDSDIPIGKGMCSSTTMVLALASALAKLYDPARECDPVYMAELAWHAEVGEFGEPGGRMDHYTSALGGLVHLDFRDGKTSVRRIAGRPEGCFLLFDSLQDKDTLAVLGNSKFPTQEGLSQLAQFGVSSIRDFYADPGLERHLERLEPQIRVRVAANIANYRIQREALEMLESGNIESKRLGELLNAHQANLRDGLGISTPVIDRILAVALEHGGLGGKFNGSGGGGCLYVYAPEERAEEILAAVRDEGYPGVMLSISNGLTVCEEGA